MIGTKAYAGTGLDAAGAYKKDMYAYDQGTNTWSPITDFQVLPELMVQHLASMAKDMLAVDNLPVLRQTGTSIMQPPMPGQPRPVSLELENMPLSHL